MSIIPVTAAGASLWPAIDTSQVGAGPAHLPHRAHGRRRGRRRIGGERGLCQHASGNALDSVQAAQANADNLANQAATGTLTNVSDYMVAAEQANIQTQLTAAVRSNALQAFQQIMGMQL